MGDAIVRIVHTHAKAKSCQLLSGTRCADDRRPCGRCHRPRPDVEIQHRDRREQCERKIPPSICAAKHGLERTAMSAAQALKAANQAGVRIGIDGAALTLEADAAPPPAVLELLSHHKAGVLALLRTGGDGRSGKDWRALFDKQARAAQFHSGLPRDQAEARALARCTAEWLNRHPVRSAPGRCLGCGGVEEAHAPLLPFGAQGSGHVWLHSHCWTVWREARKAEATAALAEMGISALISEEKMLVCGGLAE